MKKNYELTSHTEGKPYPLGVYSGQVDDTWVKYELKSVTGAQVSKQADGSFPIHGSAKMLEVISP